MAAVILTDEKLLSLLKHGDEQALSEIIHRYTPYVGTVVWNIVSDTLTLNDAEEIIADTFVALWKNIDQANRRNLKGYLGKIARNKAIDALRRSVKDLPLEENELFIPLSGPEETLTAEEEAHILRHTLDQLPEPDRTIFIRHYYLCQSTAKISAAMELNINTVQSKLKRGREKLRKILEKGGFLHE